MKYAILLAAFIGFALLNTAFLGAYVVSASEHPAAPGAATEASATYTTTNAASASSAEDAVSSGPSSTSSNWSQSAGTFGAPPSSTLTAPSSVVPFTVLTLAQLFEEHSLVLAPTSWIFVGGLWIWRGRMKSKWLDLGFDSDVFTLFVRMKGAKTRIRLLDALSVPKDRLQLAQELGLDWKAVDRHVTVLKKYGFVEDRVAYGKVRMYELTPIGQSLLHLLEELSREERQVQPLPELESQGQP